MESLSRLFEVVRPSLPMCAALILGLLLLFLFRRFLNRKLEGHESRNMKIQLIMLILSFVLLIVVIMVAPLDDSQQGQLLGLLGLVLSAVIAFSSTTFVGNAMAGFMLQAVRSFRLGDFVRVGDHFGRVSERGLFHIEIQTEDRDLTTLPNLFLVTNPVKVIRSSGTVVSADVSLGYDVPRERIKEVLIEAAEKSQLQDPFVHIVELDDFSVVYRVAGLLVEVKQLLSVRSRLREAMLDELHAARIEIVSPSFMNTRKLTPEITFIPQEVGSSQVPKVETSPENVVFDKAEEAEQMHQQFETMGEELKKLELFLQDLKEEGEREKAQLRIEKIRASRELLRTRLESLEKGD